MPQFFLALLVALCSLFRTRADTALEIRALRQQVAVLKRKRPRPSLNTGDRLFWTTLRRLWPRWSDVLLIGQTGNRGRMAPRRLSPLLALAAPERGAVAPGFRRNYGT